MVNPPGKLLDFDDKSCARITPRFVRGRGFVIIEQCDMAVLRTAVPGVTGLEPPDCHPVVEAENRWAASPKKSDVLIPAEIRPIDLTVPSKSKVANSTAIPTTSAMRRERSLCGDLL
jgi:hypothetical protein